MVNLNANVKEIDLNTIFNKLSAKDTLEIVFYFYTNSARREWFHKFFTTFDESDSTNEDIIAYEEIENIFYVFAFAYRLVKNMTPLQLFIFIDTHFNNKWLSILIYASERSYRVKYYSIIFVATQHGLLEYIDVNSILRGELEENYEQVLLNLEFTNEKIEELNKYIIEYEKAYH